MVILVIIPKMSGFESLNTKNLLKFVVFFQYMPRLLRIIPLYKEITRTSGILTETAWAGAAFNLFLYMLASHVSPCYILTYIFMKLFLGVLSIICLCSNYLHSVSGFTSLFLLSPLTIYLFTSVLEVLFFQKVYFV